MNRPRRTTPRRRRAREAKGAAISDLFKPLREGPSPAFRRFLADHGNDVITDMSVCREPIRPALETIANVVTLGRWGSIKKQLNYDSIYHLRLAITIPSGEWGLEKNEVASATRKTGGVRMQVLLNQAPLTVNALISGGERVWGLPQFWQYDPVYSNCQEWVWSMLLGSEILTPALERFILQDAASLVPEAIRPILRAVTDLGARADQGLHGRALTTRAGAYISPRSLYH
jgi:hypothetical protein